MKLVLLLDTSIQGVSMSLIDLSTSTSGFAWKAHFLERNGSAQRLSKLFREGIKFLDCEFSDIRGICVSTGPGSFTGIKVGLAWVQGLSAGLGREIRFLGVSSMEAAAAQLKQTLGVEKLDFVMGSTRTHGFLSTVESEKITTKLVDISGEEFLNGDFKTLGSSEAVSLIVGNNWTEFVSLTRESEKDYRELTDSATADLVMLGMAKKARETGFDKMSKVLDGPNFMRKSTAEERLDLQKRN